MKRHIIKSEKKTETLVPYARCISFLLFDLVGGTGILVEWASCPLQFRTGCPNTGDRENEGEPFPNAPYTTFRCDPWRI
ncbi:MAG: hypothetical protein F6K26_23175 [Moorea sp. SIO2I5]|nr:hypothetical protein [Moorena sp. SIO2I5]